LRKAGQKEKVEEMQDKATKADSYDEALTIVNEYVELV